MRLNPAQIEIKIFAREGNVLNAEGFAIQVAQNARVRLEAERKLIGIERLIGAMIAFVAL